MCRQRDLCCVDGLPGYVVTVVAVQKWWSLRTWPCHVHWDVLFLAWCLPLPSSFPRNYLLDFLFGSIQRQNNDGDLCIVWQPNISKSGLWGIPCQCCCYCSWYYATKLSNTEITSSHTGRRGKTTTRTGQCKQCLSRDKATFRVEIPRDFVWSVQSK